VKCMRWEKGRNDSERSGEKGIEKTGVEEKRKWEKKKNSEMREKGKIDEKKEGMGWYGPLREELK
jgi:hypothetical protein